MTEMEQWMAAIPNPSSPLWRSRAIKLFGFAILTQQTVDALLPHQPFMEVGAGAGYWAYELLKAGAGIAACDPNPYADPHHRPERIWTPISAKPAEDFIPRYLSYERTLLMVWPSHPDPDNWAYRALKLYGNQGGRKVIYVGEGKGGVCANDKFHDLLASDWTVASEIPLQRWQHMNDHCWVYARREGEESCKSTSPTVMSSAS